MGGYFAGAGGGEGVDLAGKWTITADADGKLTFGQTGDIDTGDAMEVTGAAGNQLTAATGTQNYLVLAPRIDQNQGAATSGYNILKLEWTHDSIGLGSKRGIYANAPAGFSGDLMKLDVNGSEKFALDQTGNMYIARSADVYKIGATAGYYFGDTASANGGFEFSGSKDQISMLSGSAYGRQFVICDSVYRDRDFDHPLRNDMVLYVQSGTDPDTDNQEFIAITHNQSGGIVETGTNAGGDDNYISLQPRGSEAWRLSGDGTEVILTRTTGTTTVKTGDIAGVARDIQHDIPIAAGGAAAAALAWMFGFDGTMESGLVAETDGAGTYREPVWQIPYYTADYGAAWAAPPAPSPTGLSNGAMFVAYNTNGGGSHRLYCYSNAGWHYVALT